MNRRRFLGSGLVAATLTGVPALAHASADSIVAAPWLSHTSRVLIVIDLAGGNDGLNTVAPYDDPMYARLRPELALQTRDVVRLNAPLSPVGRYVPGPPYPSASVYPGYPADAVNAVDTVDVDADVGASGTADAVGAVDASDAAATTTRRRGMHRALAPLMPFWRSGQMAIVEGVGFRDSFSAHPSGLAPDVSHFRAAQRWHTGAASHDYRADDWLQRALSGNAADAWIDLAPHTAFSAQVATAAQLVVARRRRAHAAPPAGASRMGLRLALSGFDTHHRQAPRHAARLAELANGLTTLHRALSAAGCWDQVCVMTTSEFGRSAAENAHGGTEHGNASTHFLIGAGVAGGFHGSAPVLPPDGGAMTPDVDFRQVYASVLDQWLQVSSDAVLGRAPVERRSQPMRLFV